MKKLLFFAALVIVTNAAFAQQPAAAAKTDAAVFEWVASAHDFGKIKQGTPVTYEFKFTNKGKVPLVITNAQPSCGCTTPDWSRNPIPPGQQGFIKATYNAAAVGPFNKSITVTANTDPGVTQLSIKGEVEAPNN